VKYQQHIQPIKIAVQLGGFTKLVFNSSVAPFPHTSLCGLVKCAGVLIVALLFFFDSIVLLPIPDMIYEVTRLSIHPKVLIKRDSGKNDNLL